MSSFHPTDLFDRIDKVNKSIIENCNGLSNEQLNWKPSPENWSIAQVLEHLIIINESYNPILDKVRSGTYKVHWLGKFRFMYNYFGNFVLKSINPANRKKGKTFKFWQPSQSEIQSDIVSRFLIQQEDLKSKITEFKDLAEKDFVINSPAGRMIVYKLSTAFEIKVTHEERHLLQLLEVRKMIQ